MRFSSTSCNYVFLKVVESKKTRQKSESCWCVPGELRSLPEADLSLLLLLLLPDNLNEVSPLESPLLAARYLIHISILLFVSYFRN